MLDTKEKEKVIKKFQTHKEDTGSDEVQAAILSERIQKILEHLKRNPKDLHSKRGLLKMVSKRRKVLKHLKAESKERYQELIKGLGLRK